MLVVTTEDLGKLHKALTSIDDIALPYAVQQSLNTSAFATRRHWEKEGRKTMNVRRSWAFRHRIPKARGGGLAHAVEKARRRKKIAQMYSKAGNTHKFMEQQERGFTRTRAKGVQIPMVKSRIGSSIKRVVRKPFHRDKMQFGRRFDIKSTRFRPSENGKSRGARYIAGTIRAARAQNKKFVFLKFSERDKGIYQITGKTRKGGIKKVWDQSSPTTRTGSNPMLRRTLKALEPTFKTAHRSALEYQIKLVLKKRGFRVRGPNMLAEVARFQAR